MSNYKSNVVFTIRLWSLAFFFRDPSKRPKFSIGATTCACPSCILSKLGLLAFQKYRLCFVHMSGTNLPKSGLYLTDYMLNFEYRQRDQTLNVRKQQNCFAIIMFREVHFQLLLSSRWLGVEFPAGISSCLGHDNLQSAGVNSAQDSY